jgi:hypothetical protein
MAAVRWSDDRQSATVCILCGADVQNNQPPVVEAVPARAVSFPLFAFPCDMHYVEPVAARRCVCALHRSTCSTCLGPGMRFHPLCVLLTMKHHIFSPLGSLI